MASHVENLKIGDWIVVMSYKHWSEVADQDGVIGRPIFDGRPLNLRAVGLPFLAVESLDGEVDAIDLRDYEIQKVGDEYAEAFMDLGDEYEDEEEPSQPAPPAARMKCPLCSSKLQERRTGPGAWVLACECGLEARMRSEQT